jgi:TonB-dependent starch-binding outer membrane protein SusC
MKSWFTKTSVLVLAAMFCSGALLAQFTVNGTVKDDKGEALIGVSVAVKGTLKGTVTDIDGKFSLDIPGESATLQLSYTGFKTIEEKVSRDNANLNLVMGSDIARLDEVVVTGLASGIKRSNSGNAVTTIKADELVGNTNPQTLDNALFGKIPGVTINSNGGAPGGGINMQFRGVSTLGSGSSQPLYIIDGVYVDNSTIRTGRTQVNGAGGGAAGGNQDDAANRIADINPDDIERMEILKGPSAAAIYGTRANAGVIIITTKRGAAGQTKVSLSQDMGFAKAQNLLGFEPWNEAKINTFYGTRAPAQLDLYRAAVAENRVTDWEQFFYGETGVLSNTQLSLSGGNQKTQFFVSGGIQSETGIIKFTDFQRYNVRANLDHKIGDRVKVSLNSSYSSSDNDRGFTGNQNNTGGSIGYNIAYTPSYANLFPNAQGVYPTNPYFNDNPIAIRDLGRNNQKVDRFITAANLEWDIYRGAKSNLRFKANGGVDYLSGVSLVYFPEIMQHQRATANPGDVMHGYNDNLNTNLQAFLTYNTELGDISSNTTVGGVRLDFASDYILNRGRGLSGGQTNLRWGRVQSVESQIDQRTTDVGWIAQQDFNWKDRINVSAGLRFDKSTLNRDQDKYYAFPKVSTAINLTKFDFWKFSAVNQFKLRAAYGETGGLPNFGVTFESLVPQLITGSLGGQVSARAVDPNLVPETAAELEFGVDLAMFNNRLTLEVTAYNKQVRDLIFDLAPAESTGITAIATNAADLVNRGLELGLGYNVVRTQNLNWFTKLLWWRNESEITDLRIPVRTVGGFGPSLGTYLLAEGFSPTAVVGASPRNTANPLNLTVFGDRQPDFQMSWANNFRFLKHFDFNFLFHYQKGGTNINLTEFLLDVGGTSPDWSQDKDGVEGPDGRNRLTAQGTNTGIYIQPTSYLKLREIGLYYTFPKPLANNFVKRMKIGVSGNNFLLWTNYRSYDPEVSNFGIQAIAGSIEVTPYPSARRMFFHLKMDF